jgi:hypothetical protein
MGRALSWTLANPHNQPERPHCNIVRRRKAGGRMSALGHKQTFRSAIATSALPPKADMCGAPAYVR